MQHVKQLHQSIQMPIDTLLSQQRIMEQYCIYQQTVHLVEVSAYIEQLGQKQSLFGELQPAEKGWVQCMKNMEHCVEAAAVTGDYGMALQAFILNPQIPSGEKAKQVLDELLLAHKKYLPQFAAKIAELEAAGVTIKDDVAREITEKDYKK